MILAINIGNTNIRAAIGNGGIEAQTVFYAHTDNIIDHLQEGFGDIWDKIKGSIIATVVPEQEGKVMKALQDKIKKPVKRVDVRNCGNLRTDKYKGLLGEDRVVCCARALQKYAVPLAVIDFGTATTINVVDKEGEFIGGAILPGLRTGLDALVRNTAQLPPITVGKSIPLIGKNTTENLESGAVIGLACAVEGFLGRIEKELGYEISVVVTGGHAPVILPYCQFEYSHEPVLLLEGLLSLWN